MLISRPESIFSKKYLCQVCFQVVSNNSKHMYCTRRVTCFHCLRKKLKPGDWYDSLMVRKYCPSDLPFHPAVNFLENEQCPKCFEQIATGCCLSRHVANCNGKHRCESCSEFIVARRGEKIEEKVALHRCGVKKCLLCFEEIDLADKKLHCCKMAPITFPRGYNQQGFFDVESFELPDKTLRDNVVHYTYESKIAGNFHGITFTHDGLNHPYSSVIRKHVFHYDYLPKSTGNEIDGPSGLIKPQGKRRRKKASQDEIFENAHWDLPSYIKQNWDKNDDIMEDYKAYYATWKKYSNTVPPSTRTRPLFKFLCFILNDKHRSRTITSHYGGRFDIIFLLQLLLEMGIQPQILPQGQGVLQMTIKEWSILFLDSFKFFPSSLASLSTRFNLEEVKGFFSHTTNIPGNWGRVRKNPPPLSSYINKRDSDKLKKEKTDWWLEVKSKAPEFRFNDHIIKYCVADVTLLMSACTKFLHQSMDFGQQLIGKFGISPSFKPGLCQPHFHPLNRGIPTLGSYG